MREVGRQARLISALAETLDDRMWADDILARCRQMEEAIQSIRAEAERRKPGER